MELRDYLRSYWKGRWVILITTVVAGVTAFGIAVAQPTRSGVSMSFAVNRGNTQATPDYQYDGYYALQATDLFAQTVVSWFSTPSILRDVYVAAGYKIDDATANTLPSKFKVKKYSSQNIVVRFSMDTNDQAATLAAALKKNMEDRANSLNQDSAGKALFSIVGSDPVIAPAKPNATVYGALAAIGGLLLGLFVVTFREALRS